MGKEPEGAAWAWSDCQRDLDEMSPPDGRPMSASMVASCATAQGPGSR